MAFLKTYTDSDLVSVKNPANLESVITVTGDTIPTLTTHDIVAAKFSVNNSIGTDPGTENLVAYWKLDEISGDSGTIFVDSSGQENDLDMVYGTVVMENAVVNNGLSSGTGSNYIERRGYTSSNLSVALATGNFSISTWVNINTESAWADLITLSMDQDDYSDFIRIEHANDNSSYTGVYFGLNEPGGAANQSIAKAGLEYSTWYHVVATCNRDGDTLTLYINGDTVAGPTHFVAGLYDYTNCQIITFLYGGTTDDKVDEVRIYDKILTRDNALFLYSNPQGKITGAQNPVSNANVNPLEVAGGGIVFNELASVPTVGGLNKGILYLGENGLYFVDKDGNNITAASYTGGSWFDVEGGPGLWHGGPIVIGDSRPATGTTGITHLNVWGDSETHHSIQIGSPGTHIDHQARFILGTKIDSGEAMGATGTKGWEIAGRGNSYSQPNNLHFGFYDGDTTVPFWISALELKPNAYAGFGHANPEFPIHVEVTNTQYTEWETVFSGGTSEGAQETGITLSTQGDGLGGMVSSNLTWLDNTISQENTVRSSGYMAWNNPTTAAKTSVLTIAGTVPGSTTLVPRVIIDGDGNVGINNIDIETLHASYSAIEFPQSSIMYRNAAVAGDGLYLTNNAYYSGPWQYKLADEASMLKLVNGYISFNVSNEVGAEDGTITWTEAMRITNDGKVVVGSAVATLGFNVESGGALFGPPGGIGMYMPSANMNTLSGSYGSTSNEATLWLNYLGYQAGTSYFRDTIIGNGKGVAIFRADGSTGNIGFGADTTPDENLHIQDASDDPAIKLEKTGTDAGSGTIVYNSADASIDFIIE